MLEVSSSKRSGGDPVKVWSRPLSDELVGDIMANLISHLDTTTATSVVAPAYQVPEPAEGPGAVCTFKPKLRPA